MIRHAHVFGNVAIDEVLLVGTLPAPGESVLATAGYTGLGGKGANQAIALARTGVPTTLVAAVGRDRHGATIRNALGSEPLDARLIERSDLASDRSVILAQDGGDNLIVTTNACAQSLTSGDCATALARISSGDAVLLQGNLRAEVTAALARGCADRGAWLALNPSPFDLSMRDVLPLMHVVFVNETEAKGLTGLSGTAAVAALLAAGVRQVVLTLGAKGALLGGAAGLDGVIHVPATPARVVDVTGAGDCFAGVAIGSALLRGKDLLDDAALLGASRAAAVSIGTMGAASSFPDAARMSALLGEGTRG